MLIYLHGFNSSPESVKARLLGGVLAQAGLGERYACPALPHLPAEAIETIELAMAGRPKDDICLLGSSLGGFYATHLAEKHGVRAVLINPAVNPHIGLRANLGPQQNLYSGERYELSEEHLRQWERLDVPAVSPERYLLLVETDDEVLDYRVAVRKYRGAKQVVVQGGDHSLRSFPEQIPLILEFAGFPPVAR
jgi:predicted esterase YcpF (UPF0227 family)